MKKGHLFLSILMTVLMFGNFALASETDSEQENSLNFLWGKTALFVGDSIVIGNGAETNPSYGPLFEESTEYITWYSRKAAATASRYIGEWNKMTIYNYAVCGATLANVDNAYPNLPNEQFNELFPEYINRKDNWVISQIRRYAEEMEQGNVPQPDYIIIEGGVNDIMTPGIEIGQVTTGEPGDMVFNYEDNTYELVPFTAENAQSTAGAFEELVYYVYKHFRGTKVGFMSMYPLRKYSYKESEERWDVLETACKKWGVPYLDLFHEIGIGIYVSDAEGNADSYNVNIHPDTEFNKNVMAPKIEAWMRSFGR